MGIQMTETGVVNARFQIPHLKHIEYVLAAKMRCRKLYIGITNPDPSCVRESVNDEIRSTPEANPLTYLERFEMIKASMEEFGVPRSDYEIVPFPIHRPEYITQYTPADAVYYLGICDGWDEEKLKILKGLGLEDGLGDADSLVQSLRRASAMLEAVIVLKAASVWIADADGIYIYDGANPSLGVAGSGDVLAGIIGTLLAQGEEPLAAAMDGVILHQRAGRKAHAEYGYYPAEGLILEVGRLR